MKNRVQGYEEYRDYQSQWFRSPRGRYHQHKSKARQRSIPWRLTYEEWWEIWQASGKWEQRGRRHDQYVMARFKDRGAYERNNVRICLVAENTEEMRQALPPRSRRSTEEQRAANRAYKQRERQGVVLKDPARSEKAMGRRMVIRMVPRRCWAYPGDQDYPD